MVVTKILSDRGTNGLGDFEVQYQYEPKAVAAVERFYSLYSVAFFFQLVYIYFYIIILFILTFLNKLQLFLRITGLFVRLIVEKCINCLVI